MKFYQKSLFKAFLAVVIAISSYLFLPLSLYIIIYSTVVVVAFLAIEGSINVSFYLIELLVKTAVAFSIVSLFIFLAVFLGEFLK